MILVSVLASGSWSGSWSPSRRFRGHTTVTFRSLYLAGQHIRRLPASAFAALNVRRIVLDFNPLGDRIDPLSFHGTVDLARAGLVPRRSSRTSRRAPAPTRSRQLNDSDAVNVDRTASRRANAAAAHHHSRRYARRLRIGRMETSKRALECTTYTVSQKKQDTRLLPITLPNINRFSNLFSLADSVVNSQQAHV